MNLFANTAVELRAGSWVNNLKLSQLMLAGATTGTAYSAGVFTDGVAITPANLDTYNGLFNPRTGARYAAT